MDIIKSKDNKTIKYISKLIKSSKFRKEECRFVVEGVRLCEEALINDTVIDYLVYSVSSFDKNTDIILKLTDKASSVICVEDRIFSALSDTKTPQGVLCVVKTLDKQAHFDTIKKNGIILALDNIQDPSYTDNKGYFEKCSYTGYTVDTSVEEGQTEEEKVVNFAVSVAIKGRKSAYHPDDAA